MKNVGIDLHKRSLLVAVVDERGEHVGEECFGTCEVERIEEFFTSFGGFRAVIEASASYRWLYNLFSPHGEVILAHPSRLEAIVSGRAKTDKLDARLLAQLLWGDLIPETYIPPKEYHPPGSGVKSCLATFSRHYLLSSP